MKYKNLWLLVGAPGCGKSTWVKENAPHNSIIVSRDQIRFSLLKEGENYFAHEDEAFKLYIETIQHYIDIDDNKTQNIYADATHLNWKSRNKVLSNLKYGANVRIHAVFFNVPLDTCLSRNAEREGRARVPDSAIRNMYKSITNPQLDIFQYDSIIIVNYYTKGSAIPWETNRPRLSNCSKCVWYASDCAGKQWDYELCPTGMKFKRDPPDGGYYG